jgi:hypothetical protein
MRPSPPIRSSAPAPPSAPTRLSATCALRTIAVPLAGALLAAATLGGCGLARTVNRIDDAVHANSALIDLFTAKLKSGQPSSFEATYVTTGSSPSKIIYAVRPPGQLAFTDTQAGTGVSVGPSSFRFVVNSAGEYICTPPGTGTPGTPGASGTGGGSGTPRWSCQKLRRSALSGDKAIVGFYTPAHWVTFLRDFSLAAGFAGDKISASRRTVNGFAMQCVDFVAAGVKGTSRICTTRQHLLGLVQVASETTGFEITSYSPSPAPGLFRLPPGAVVTTPKGAS